MFQNLAALNLSLILVYFFYYSLLVSIFQETKETALTFATAPEFQPEYTQMIENQIPGWIRINVGLSISLAAIIIFLYSQLF